MSVSITERIESLERYTNTSELLVAKLPLFSFLRVWEIVFGYPWLVLVDMVLNPIRLGFIGIRLACLLATWIEYLRVFQNVNASRWVLLFLMWFSLILFRFELYWLALTTIRVSKGEKVDLCCWLSRCSISELYTEIWYYLLSGACSTYFFFDLDLRWSKRTPWI